MHKSQQVVVQHQGGRHMNSYTTSQGDTWDLIAYKLWGERVFAPSFIRSEFET